MSSGRTATRQPVPWRRLGRDQWMRIAKSMYARFGEVEITDRAAALTYYAVLSLFPGLLAVVALLALVGKYPETYESVVDWLRDAAPGTWIDTINSALRDALSNRANAGPLLAVGLGVALISASGATGAAMRSLEVINRVKSGRDFLPSLGVRLGLTCLLTLLVFVAFLAVAVAGPLLDLADAAGVEGFFKDLIGYARWPIGALSLGTAVAVMYSLGPRRGPPRGTRSLRAVMPGAMLAVVIWIVASLLFTLYLSQFGSYDKTYGTLGALISLLVWLWLGNLAFLLGALFNAESQRVRGGGR